MDIVLSPEMKSTGEAIGYDYSLNRALYKSLRASGLKVSNYGTILATICDVDKDRALPLIRRAAIDNNVPVFTCLDTVKVLLDVLEEITMKVSVIDQE